MEVKIIFEDSGILVLDKPSGITVNRSDTTQNEQTLQDWVEEYLKVEKVVKVGQAEKNTTSTTLSTYSTFSGRSGIVHRLDKETSGILIVAKTPEAFENLQKQFKERKVKKTYIALVHGKVTPKEGEIRVPVGRLPWNRKRFGVVAGGREAVTKYKVLSIKYYVLDKKREPLTLLEIYPETGRTHQIRVHLKYAHHPIFGDTLYAGRKTSRNDRKILPRVFLHASKISFYYPKTNEYLTFESKLPLELEKMISTLTS